MIKFYSRSHFRSLCSKHSKDLLYTGPSVSKFLSHQKYFNFNTENKQDDSKEFEDYVITEEQLFSSQYLPKKTFRERNKLTLSLLGSGIVFKFLGIFTFQSMSYSYKVFLCSQLCYLEQASFHYSELRDIF